MYCTASIMSLENSTISLPKYYMHHSDKLPCVKDIKKENKIQSYYIRYNIKKIIADDKYY